MGRNFDNLTELQEHVADVPAEMIPALLSQLAALQGSLAARLLNRDDTASAPSEPRLLKVSAAAERLQMSEDYLYRHADDLPFTVRKGRMLRFSEPGIEKWIRNRSGK